MEGKNRGWLVGLAIVLLLLSGCSKNEKAGAEQVDHTQEKPEIIEVEDEQEGMDDERALFPTLFTGVKGETEVGDRAVLATINNHPQARPQSGLSAADIVYEFVAEGNVTRFLALFQSELPESIGPVRSARDYFIELAKGMDAFYVAHGYSPDAKALLDKRYVDHVNGMQYDGILFKRSVERKAPHNSYISNENVRKAIEMTKSQAVVTKIPPFTFHESLEDAKIEDIASMLVVRFSNNKEFISTFAYNPDNGTYQRMVNDVLTVDKENNLPVEVANVVVIETAHRTIDNEGRQAVDIESGGKAMLFQAGAVKEIEWKNIDGFIVPVEDGVPVKLVPGKTWFHVIPTSLGLAKSVSYTP